MDEKSENPVRSDAGTTSTPHAEEGWGVYTLGDGDYYLARDTDEARQAIYSDRCSWQYGMYGSLPVRLTDQQLEIYSRTPVVPLSGCFPITFKERLNELEQQSGPINPGKFADSSRFY